MMAPMTSSYPHHFSEALIHHCVRSGIPPEVFEDLAMAVRGPEENKEDGDGVMNTSIPLPPLCFPSRLSSSSSLDTCSLSRLPRRQGSVLARYVRLRSSSVPLLLELGTRLIAQFMCMENHPSTIRALADATGVASEEEKDVNHFLSRSTAGSFHLDRPLLVQPPPSEEEKSNSTSSASSLPHDVQKDMLHLLSLCASLSTTPLSREERRQHEWKSADEYVRRWMKNEDGKGNHSVVMEGQPAPRTTTALSHGGTCDRNPSCTPLPSADETTATRKLENERNLKAGEPVVQPTQKLREDSCVLFHEDHRRAWRFEGVMYDTLKMVMTFHETADGETGRHRTRDDHQSCGAEGTEMEVDVDNVQEKLPPLILLWFAVSYVLHLPLLYVSPIRWTLPSFFSSCSSSSVSRWAASASCGPAGICFAVSPLYQVRLRGTVDLPRAMLSTAGEMLVSSLPSTSLPDASGYRVPLSCLLLPMDVASVAAVLALRPTPHERLLDMCCSPGMKLQAAAEKVRGKASSLFLGAPLLAKLPSSVPRPTEEEINASVRATSVSHGIVVGVDKNPHRLFVTRSLLQQPSPPCASPSLSSRVPGPPGSFSSPLLPVALFWGDGTDFSFSHALETLQLPAPRVPSSIAVASPSPPLVVSPLTGLTARETYQLRKSTTRKEVSPASRGDGEGLKSFPVGFAPSTIPPPPTRHANRKPHRSAVLPVYAPEEVRQILASVLDETFTSSPVIPVSDVPKKDMSLSGEEEHKMEHQTRKREREKDHGSSTTVPLLFDGALVDVECTHDGSLAHVDITRDKEAMPLSSGEEEKMTEEEEKVKCKKDVNDDGRPRTNNGTSSPTSPMNNDYRMGKWNIPTLSSSVSADAPPIAPPLSTAPPLPPSSPLLHRCPKWFWFPIQRRGDRFYRWLREDSLLQLQLALLFNTFSQLRLGGRLIYSTCSMSYLQNEYIVQCFLRLFNRSFLEDNGDTPPSAREEEEEECSHEKAVQKDTSSPQDPMKCYGARLVPAFPRDLFEKEEEAYRHVQLAGEEDDPTPWHTEQKRREKEAGSSPWTHRKRPVSLGHPSSSPACSSLTTSSSTVLLRLLILLQERILSFSSSSSSLASTPRGSPPLDHRTHPPSHTASRSPTWRGPLPMSFVNTRVESYADFCDILATSQDAYGIVSRGTATLYSMALEEAKEGQDMQTCSQWSSVFPSCSSRDTGSTVGHAFPSPCKKGEVFPMPHTTTTTTSTTAAAVTSGPAAATTRTKRYRREPSIRGASYPLSTVLPPPEKEREEAPKEDQDRNHGDTFSSHGTHPTLVGSRLWPLALHSSFQFIAKIEKIKRGDL